MIKNIVNVSGYFTMGPTFYQVAVTSMVPPELTTPAGYRYFAGVYKCNASIEIMVQSGTDTNNNEYSAVVEYTKM
jgi:hypothetical protein